MQGFTYLQSTAQYFRIETAAGGSFASDRAFIRSARRLIAPVMRGSIARGMRRGFYREIAEVRERMRKLAPFLPATD